MLDRSPHDGWFWRRLRLVACVLFPAVSATQGGSASEQLAPRQPADPRVIVILGDSLTAGYGLDPAQAYPSLLQQRINAAGWSFTVLNAGQSGDTTAGGLRRLDWQLQRPVAVLILALGANDGLRGIDTETTKANLQAMIDRAKQKDPAIRIMLASMRLPPNLGPDYVSRFQAIYPDLAKQNQVTLIPFLLEGVAGRPDSNQDDMIHPTAAGQKIVADNLWRVLQPLLKEMVAAQ